VTYRGHRLNSWQRPPFCFDFLERDRTLLRFELHARQLSAGPSSCGFDRRNVSIQKSVIVSVTVSETIMLTSEQISDRTLNRTICCTRLVTLYHFVSIFAKARCARRKQRQFKVLRRSWQCPERPESYKKTPFLSNRDEAWLQDQPQRDGRFGKSMTKWLIAVGRLWRKMVRD